MESPATAQSRRREKHKWPVLRADLVTLLFFSAFASCRSYSYSHQTLLVFFLFNFCTEDALT